MVQLGKLTLDMPFFQAGLAGYSDAAMRLVARQHGCPYCISEAMLDSFLIQGGKSLVAAELDDRDHPIAGQLMGSHPQDIAQGARILLKLGYDVIDINLACPVKKIRKKARGGHLMSVPDEAVAILKAVKDAVGDDAPCTVKLRRGTDDSPEAEQNFHTIFQAVIDLGYAGAVVHSRTVEQKYLGPGRRTFLAELTNQYQQAMNAGFVIGGSGDIWQASDVKEMIEQTGIQLVSIARGCIGNPWIFRQARALMQGDMIEAQRPPTVFEQRDVLYEHFRLSVALHGQAQASRMMRKFGIRFARHHHAHDVIRQAFIRVKSFEDWEQVLADYYREDHPGVAIENALPEEAQIQSCDADG